MKKILKDILITIVILGVAFGGYKLWDNYNNSQIEGDTSYKDKTKRNSKYSGVYTLTKLDENGNNTWNGLIMYVKNDKIISANLEEYESRKFIVKNYLNGNTNATDDEILSAAKALSTVGFSNAKETCFSTGGQHMVEGFGVAATKGQILFKDKIDFRKDYADMKKCNVVAGYDEDSQEIWLSKLLSNEKSEYHKDYKLIRYTSYKELSNCPLDGGLCVNGLNTDFNAGLRELGE